uniref:Uncharacterized protein n=1 Tax=Caenorhabditis tropicalis TaxID=1561998 RepID=A0A1I7TPA7_9PELO
MKFISTLFKKFNKSSSSKTQKATTSSSENNIWSHNEPSNYDEKLKKFETRQKKMDEEKEMKQERRTLRRQNRFLGFQNDLEEVSEKKNQIVRRLQKQKRITEYYRRQIAEMQRLQQVSVIDN